MVDSAGHTGRRRFSPSHPVERDTAWYPRLLGVDMHLLYTHLQPGLAGPTECDRSLPACGNGAVTRPVPL